VLSAATPISRRSQNVNNSGTGDLKIERILPSHSRQTRPDVPGTAQLSFPPKPKEAMTTPLGWRWPQRFQIRGSRRKQAAAKERPRPKSRSATAFQISGMEARATDRIGVEVVMGRPSQLPRCPEDLQVTNDNVLIAHRPTCSSIDEVAFCQSCFWAAVYCSARRGATR